MRKIASRINYFMSNRGANEGAILGALLGAFDGLTVEPIKAFKYLIYEIQVSRLLFQNSAVECYKS